MLSCWFVFVCLHARGFLLCFFLSSVCHWSHFPLQTFSFIFTRAILFTFANSIAYTMRFVLLSSNMQVHPFQMQKENRSGSQRKLLFVWCKNICNHIREVISIREVTLFNITIRFIRLTFILEIIERKSILNKLSLKHSMEFKKLLFLLLRQFGRVKFEHAQGIYIIYEHENTMTPLCS